METKDRVFGPKMNKRYIRCVSIDLIDQKINALC